MNNAQPTFTKSLAPPVVGYVLQLLGAFTKRFRKAVRLGMSYMFVFQYGTSLAPGWIFVKFYVEDLY